MVRKRLAASATGHHNLGPFRFLKKPMLIMWTKPALVSFMPSQQQRTYSFLAPIFPMLLQRHLLQNRDSIFDPTEPSTSGGSNINNNRQSHPAMSYPFSQLCKATLWLFLWEKHANAILHELGLTPTIHEPCLYSGVIAGQHVVFMQQLDNFAIAIAAPDKNTSDFLLNLMDEQLSIPLKR